MSLIFTEYLERTASWEGWVNPVFAISGKNEVANQDATKSVSYRRLIESTSTEYILTGRSRARQYDQWSEGEIAEDLFRLSLR